PSTALPSALPNCCTAVSVPAAEPVSCGSTAASTVWKNGPVTSPIPTPTTTSAGAPCHTVTRVPADRSAQANTPEPSAITTTPACTSGRPNLPSTPRPSSTCTTAKPTTVPADHGSTASPAFSGEALSPDWK